MFVYNDVKLSKLEKSLLPQLWELKQESWFGTHNVSIINADDQEKWFVSLDNDPVSPKNLVLVGFTNTNGNFGIFKIFNVNWVNRTADVGWDVFRDHRNKGLGKKLVRAGSLFCFQILNLRRLTAEILSYNVASQTCALLAGFNGEGVKRQAVVRGKDCFDSLMFGLLASEIRLDSEEEISG